MKRHLKNKIQNKINIVDRIRYVCSNTKTSPVISTKYEEREMKNIKQNKKGMRRIRRENTKIYKTHAGAILHTDTTSPDVTARITTFLEKRVNWLSD